MDKAVRAIIEARYDKCVARVVHRLRRIPAEACGGDGSPVRTLWDHWKQEMQEEHSIMHRLIEDMVEGVVRRVVDDLSPEDGALLTLATDALDDLDEEPDGPVFVADAVAAELMSRVNSRACNEPHRRKVQRQLNDADRDRFERDNEPYMSRSREEASCRHSKTL
jgi:hypothetical protein